VLFGVVPGRCQLLTGRVEDPDVGAAGGEDRGDPATQGACSDDRDGSLVYYDINALSNFVADAPRVIGFDPFQKLADYLEKEAR